MEKTLSLLMFGCIVLSATVLSGQKDRLTFQNAFKSNDLNKIEIKFDKTDWRAALNATHSSVDAAISINEGGQIQVGIAKKGNTSYNNTSDRDKMPLKVNGPGGFNFKLNNNYLDVSMGAREYIGYKLHREFTGIGSGTAPTEVYVNGTFYGLYLAVEDLNRRFYEDNLEGITQRVKANATKAHVHDSKPYSNLFWSGRDPKYYEGHYEIKNGNIRELIDLINVINNDPDEAYRHIDIEQVCKFLAVENYIINKDGIIGELFSHNYELVKRKKDDKWQLVPWDLNLCLGAWNKRSMPKGDEAIDAVAKFPLTSGSNKNALIELIMDKYFSLYHYYYGQLIKKLANGRIVSWAQSYRELIRKSEQRDDKLYDFDLFEKAYTENLNTADGYVTALIPTIEKRYAYLNGLSLDEKFSDKKNALGSPKE